MTVPELAARPPRQGENRWSSLSSGDVMAAFTTAVMMVPQAVAYAMLAGLPPSAGLYAAILPGAVYGLLGTCRQLSVGPVAILSLMLASALAGRAEHGTDAYVRLAALLAVMVGLTQLTMGLFRLGFLVNFLSQPVVIGFTSAAAILIATSQLKYMLGVPLASDAPFWAVWMEAMAQVPNWSKLAVGIGLGSAAFLWIMKRKRPTFPAALVVVVVGAGLSRWFHFDQNPLAVVGFVPGGLPHFSVPEDLLGTASTLWVPAMTIAAVGFMESISVGRMFSKKFGYDIQPNRELLALGAANLVGGLFQGYPVDGGLSRSSVNANAGARSGNAAVLTAVLVAAAAVFLTPVLAWIPKASLAAIVLMAVLSLIDHRHVLHLWRVKRADLVLLGVTFVATLTIGVEQGVLSGIAASIAWFVVRTTRPHTARLGRVPGTTVYRNCKNFPGAEEIPGVLIVRMDAQFYFGNISFLKETLKKFEAELSEPLSAVIIDASAMNDLDSSADAALHEIEASYAQRGVVLLFSNVKGPVRKVMISSGLCGASEGGHFFLTNQEAVDYLMRDQTPLSTSSKTSGPSEP
jgi:sulfate permease, SulP family